MEILNLRKKILIIQTAFLGDAILTLPLIQETKKKYSEYEIDVVCIPSSKFIFEASPSVNKTIVFNKKGIHKSILGTLAFATKLRKEKYSKVISPHRSFRTSLIVLLSNAKERVGFSTASFGFVYNKIIKYNKKIHEVERNLLLLDSEKFKNNWKIFPKLNLPSVKSLGLKNIPTDKNIICIAPGTVWSTKEYPKEYFVEIIEYLVEKEYFVLLIGGKEDEKLCKWIEQKFKFGVQSIAGQLSIVESIAVLKISTLIICNDSAPTHMAMAADVAVLTLYCSTAPKFGFYPYNDKSSFLSYDEIDCKPCGIHGYDKCPIDTFDCGFKLKPEKVISKIEEMLGGK